MEQTNNTPDKYRKLLNYITHINELRNKPEYKLPYAANLIDIVKPHESIISQMLSCIFNYYQDNKPIIVRDFVDKFLSKYGFDETVEQPLIKTEEGRIDILIYEKGRYSIIFENKLNGANFQRNQLARYIQEQINVGYKEHQIFIVLLPSGDNNNYVNDIPKSVWRLPLDWKKSNNERKCSIKNTLCRCDNSKDKFCDTCIDFRERFQHRTIVLRETFSDWLSSEVSQIDEKETILRAAMELFSDYLNGLYGERINNKLLVEMKNYLMKELFSSTTPTKEKRKIVLETIEGTKCLRECLEQLKNDILICEWYDKLEPNWKQLIHRHKNEYGNFFYIEIAGDIKIGCWAGGDNNSKPYWGFQTKENGEPTEVQKNLVKKFFDDNEPPHYCEDEKFGWIAWDDTDEGDKNITNFIKKAKKLNLLDKKGN